MRAPVSYEWALIRVVPRVERGECLNAGVIVCSRERRYLAARIGLDVPRLLALAPWLTPGEVEAIERQLATIEQIVAGDPGGGPIAALDLPERWHWLVSPSSTIIQPSPAHTGITDDPARELDELFRDLVTTTA